MRLRWKLRQYDMVWAARVHLSYSAFVIFYVDVEEETVYYLPLQDYFISKPELFDKLDNNKSQITVHVPCDNIVCENDFDLQQIAKSIYIDGPSRKLRKV